MTGKKKQTNKMSELNLKHDLKLTLKKINLDSLLNIYSGQPRLDCYTTGLFQTALPGKHVQG